MKSGPREKLLYTVTVQPNLDEPHGDYLSTIDVDPESPTYCQIIHRTFTNRKGDELHHSGWNACSSCYYVDENAKTIPKRDRLVLPALNSDFVYILDVVKDPRKPEIIKTIDGDVLKSHNVTGPHTTHCLANGNIMISVMGDAKGNAKGDFILFDSDFNCIGTWTKGEEKALCGYDFWYQPYFDVMVASEWGAPNKFRRPPARYVKGRRLEGGPQMMQLSLDGKRLYVSSSLYSPWDKQFYPKMVSKGGHVCLIDVDTVNGGISLNEDFFVDFANEPYGPGLPHEMRYPGGDCTSDIWLANDE
ncbi:GL23146 [Drosophila persimilis]|uniref:GL23146 n=1 Tax=Drosophila persimilis TaxID=7234 RepID=B4G5L3_DROPE|nr:GL23146 [Drosophila persimilis]